MLGFFLSKLYSISDGSHQMKETGGGGEKHQQLYLGNRAPNCLACLCQHKMGNQWDYSCGSHVVTPKKASDGVTEGGILAVSVQEA